MRCIKRHEMSFSKIVRKLKILLKEGMQGLRKLEDPSRELEDALDSLQVHYIILVQMRILFEDGGGLRKLEDPSRELEDVLDSLQLHYILLIQMRILYKDGGYKEAGGRSLGLQLHCI